MSEWNRKDRRQTNRMSEWSVIERPELKPSGKGKVAKEILDKFESIYEGIIFPSDYRLDHIAYNGDEVNYLPTSREARAPRHGDVRQRRICATLKRHSETLNGNKPMTTIDVVTK